MTIQRILRNSIGAVVLAALLVTLVVAPATASARVLVSVAFAPPLIPVYAQPIAPGYGYIWTPGYWAYDDGWVWVDGAWVEPPYVGALWTPGYWGWGGAAYIWYPGYWGRTVGYYGGINYGFGYFGVGFYGGYWGGGHFFYNSAYNHLGFRDHEGFVYNRPVAGFESGRPGGAAFARTNGNEGRGEIFNHGSAVNGNTFASRGNFNTENRSGQTFAATNRSAYSSNQSTYQARAFSGISSYNAPQARSYSGGSTYSAPQARSYSGGTSYSAPQSRSFSGGGNSGGGARASFSGGGGGGHAGGGHR
jgi:hypothetical protein